MIVVAGTVVCPFCAGFRGTGRIRLLDCSNGFVRTAWLVQVGGDIQFGHGSRHLSGEALRWFVDQRHLVCNLAAPAVKTRLAGGRMLQSFVRHDRLLVGDGRPRMDSTASQPGGLARRHRHLRQ
ncbi:hypothetical protein [Streptomyces sp. ATCC 21386]|uniref:hypothetical protein n=1 Tax=Streptomyces sp. ATCC 21386 TaxID=2699428 RepID=UPI001BFF2729|nr:hypothetical protein [Streptomyces sp. ATCC 21386]